MELARNLKVECVSRLQPSPAYLLPPTASAGDAVDLMRQHRVGCVLIKEKSELLGIFTERDLLRRVLAVGLPLTTPLRQVMTPNPVSVQPQESIAAAIRSMEEGGYRHLLVTDEKNQSLGILSVRRILQYLGEHFPETVRNQPPVPGSYPRAAEGA